MMCAQRNKDTIRRPHNIAYSYDRVYRVLTNICFPKDQYYYERVDQNNNK